MFSDIGQPTGTRHGAQVMTTSSLALPISSSLRTYNGANVMTRWRQRSSRIFGNHSGVTQFPHNRFSPELQLNRFLIRKPQPRAKDALVHLDGVRVEAN